MPEDVGSSNADVQTGVSETPTMRSPKTRKSMIVVIKLGMAIFFR